MMLAAAGQAAPYTHNLHVGSGGGGGGGGGVGSGGATTANASGARKINNAGSGTPKATSHSTSTSTSATVARPSTSIASNASALMKTLSVRLHRGTEFINSVKDTLKDTVQKALVVSSATPSSLLTQQQQRGVVSHINSQFPDQDQEASNLKRKLSGAGGLMGCGSNYRSNSTSSTSIVNPSPSRVAQLAQPYVVPTSAFLKHYTVVPTALHRSTSARKRNPSTDSLLMDLCMFKPIRPMPITPIKINKARGFELKRPKYVSANADSDIDEEEEEEVHRPKHSTLTLPHADSAFVPMLYTKTYVATATHTTNTTTITTTTTTTTDTTTNDSNTHTSASGIAKPKASAKRRRRAPLLTAKRRRKPAAKPSAGSTTPASLSLTASKVRKRKVATPTSAPAPALESTKRSRHGSPAAAAAAAAPKCATDSSISPMRPSPPMTRQRARQQISASNSSRAAN